MIGATACQRTMQSKYGRTVLFSKSVEEQMQSIGQCFHVVATRILRGKANSAHSGCDDLLPDYLAELSDSHKQSLRWAQTVSMSSEGIGSSSSTQPVRPRTVNTRRTQSTRSKASSPGRERCCWPTMLSVHLRGSTIDNVMAACEFVSFSKAWAHHVQMTNT